MKEANMPQPEDYDLVVLGSGAPGKLLAWALASRGRRAAVVERKYVGGSCPNIACLPSKNVIHSAKVASYFRRGAEFGAVAGAPAIDMSAVRDRKRRMVADLVEVHLAKFRASGAELVLGAGRFTGPRTIEVARRDAGAPRGERRRQHRDAGYGRRDARPPGRQAAHPR